MTLTIHTTEAVHSSGREHWRKIVAERCFLDVKIDVVGGALHLSCVFCLVSRQLLSSQGSSGFEVHRTDLRILRCLFSICFLSHNISVIRAFRPDIILLGAGFDAAAEVQRRHTSHVALYILHFTMCAPGCWQQPLRPRSTPCVTRMPYTPTVTPSPITAFSSLQLLCLN